MKGNSRHTSLQAARSSRHYLFHICTYQMRESSTFRLTSHRTRTPCPCRSCRRILGRATNYSYIVDSSGNRTRPGRSCRRLNLIQALEVHTIAGLAASWHKPKSWWRVRRAMSPTVAGSVENASYRRNEMNVWYIGEREDKLSLSLLITWSMLVEWETRVGLVDQVNNVLKN